jgi:hypothetical protein
MFALTVSILLYFSRLSHPMIYYSGVSPVVPGGKASAIFNPFRRTKDETTALSLIADLRTERCGEIVRVRLHGNPAEVCPVMNQNAAASLIWLDEDKADTTSLRIPRRLIYDLPEAKARLVIYFRNEEYGWGVETVIVSR